MRLDARLCRKERTVEVDRQHSLPLRKGKAFDRMYDLDARVADENIDAAPFRDDVRNPVSDLLLVRHVHHECCRDAAGGLDFRDRTACRLDLQVGDGNFAAFASETRGDGLTNAARGTCHDANLVLQLHE